MFCGLKSFFILLQQSCASATVFLTEQIFSLFWNILLLPVRLLYLLILYIGDFNVQNTEWLGSFPTDLGEEGAESFGILKDLDLLIKNLHTFRIVRTSS